MRVKERVGSLMWDEPLGYGFTAWKQRLVLARTNIDDGVAQSDVTRIAEVADVLWWWRRKQTVVRETASLVVVVAGQRWIGLDAAQLWR